MKEILYANKLVKQPDPIIKLFKNIKDTDSNKYYFIPDNIPQTKMLHKLYAPKIINPKDLRSIPIQYIGMNKYFNIDRQTERTENQNPGNDGGNQTNKQGEKTENNQKQTYSNSPFHHKDFRILAMLACCLLATQTSL